MDEVSEMAAAHETDGELVLYPGSDPICDPETEQDTEHDAGTGEEDHGEEDHGEEDHGEEDHGEEDHGEEDHGEEGTEEEGESKPDSSLTPQQRARHALTGRGVTLSMLMADGVIEPGEDNMSIEYLGQKFTADLLSDGRIRWREEDKLFGSPSAWAIHCKKIVNPMKKSGCGWASVKYKGKKLNSFKSTWTRKQRPISGMQLTSANRKEDLLDESSDGEEPDEKKIKEETDDDVSQYGGIKQDQRRSVYHGTLGRKSHLHDPNTQVECTSFSVLGKIQPFNITMSTNAMLLMDFHCHLSGSEVLGYLGGKWDSSAQCVSIDTCLPCVGTDKDAVNQLMLGVLAKRGLKLVGWYHSHPRSHPDPSLRDLEAHMEYQLAVGGPQHSYQPCLAVILSPHDMRHQMMGSKESAMHAIWVMPPSEQRALDYGMPMSMSYDVKQDLYLSTDMLTQMKGLVDFYRDEGELIDFSSIWQHNHTMLDKLKGSLMKKLPKEVQTSKVLEYVKHLLQEQDTSNLPA